MISDKRMVEFLHEYGCAKFGDEWWPGEARAHFTKAQQQKWIDVLAEVEE